MEIKIEEYLSTDEIKCIVVDEVRRHVRNCIGEVSVSSDKGLVLIKTLAKTLAKDGIQELIPDFKELLSKHIEATIKEIKLSEFFAHSYGWQSTGNKVLNEILSNNKPLLDAKVKEIFKVCDK
jgi:hypothetical protein